MPPPRSSLRSRLLLALTSLVFALLLAEGGLRLHGHLVNRGLLSEALSSPVEMPEDGRLELGHMVRLSANPKIIYELKPNLAGTFKGAPMTTNASGFRGADRDRAKPPGTIRIVGLGDSVMFGHGIGDAEVYLAQLEWHLNRKSTGPRFEAINTAVPGYNTVMEVETLKDRGLAYEPDLVVIHLVGNDLELPNFIRVKAPILSPERFFVVDAVRGAFEQPNIRGRLRRQGLVKAPQDVSYRRFAGDPEQVPPEHRGLVGWNSYEAAMRELRDLGEEHRFRVALVTLSSPFTELHRRVLALGRELGFLTRDVGEVYRAYLAAHGMDDYRTSPLALAPDNRHPSALGHRITARALYRFLCRTMFENVLASCELSTRVRSGAAARETGSGQSG